MAVCVCVVGCGGSSTPEESPASVTSSSEVTGLPSITGGQEPASETGNDPKENPDPPGVPGSPIDYDSTLLGAPGITPEGVKGSIEFDLERECGVNRCGVTVKIEGSGNCAVKIGPDPVRPGQTVTVVAGQCSSEEGPPGSDSVTPTTEEEIPTSAG